MFDVGIIGGMGPAATAELFRRVVLYTAAQKDQDHIKICILNDPTIPDRTEYLLHDGESPFPQIINNVHMARLIGCKYFAIPCNTSHCFYRSFEMVQGIIFINMVKETCGYAASTYGNKRMCILATLGTVDANVYKEIGADAGCIVYPSEETNRDIMRFIRMIKAGETNLSEMAQQLEDQLRNEFAWENTVFVLACTELSMLLPYLKGCFIDAMDVLAGVIVTKCGKMLNQGIFKLDNTYFVR